MPTVNLLTETAIEAYKRVLDLGVEEALTQGDGKEDTLNLDAVPEQVIIDKLKDEGIVVTEEAGVVPEGARFNSSGRVYIVDPMDMSKQVIGFIKKYKKDESGNPMTIRGELEYRLSDDFSPGVISISEVEDGQLIANVMVNTSSGNLYLASPEGVKFYAIVDGELVGEREIKPKASKGYVATTVGGSEKPHYYGNVSKLGLNGIAKHVEQGPHRIFYLTDRYPYDDVGGILSMGEKIIDWIGWLAYLKYGDGLAALELYQEEPVVLERNGIVVPLSIAPEQSVFQENALDLSVLNNYKNPSEYRSLVAVMPEPNIPYFSGILEERGIEFKQLKL